MTDELRLVLVFVACILSEYSIGVSVGTVGQECGYRENFGYEELRRVGKAS